MTRRDFGKPAFSLRKKTLRENTCPIASGDYSTPVSQRGRLGIGPINWNDWVKRDNLNEYVIGYLCKMDQYFRPKWGPKVKLIRRGDYPDIFAIPLGRPRKATAKKFWCPR